MKLSKKLFRDLFILLFGIAGIGCFFYSFSNHHPFAIGQIHLSKTQIMEKADSTIQSWQFQSLDYYPSTQFSLNDGLIDSLQKKWGTKVFKKKVKESEFLQQLPLLNWQVNEYASQNEERGVEIKVGLNTLGEPVSFEASNEMIVRQRPFNRFAVRAVFQDQVEKYSRSLEDSLISGLTDYQHLNNNGQDDSRTGDILQRLRKIRGSEDEEAYSMYNIWKLADFYIDRTLWANFDLAQDSVRLMDESGIRFARSFYSVKDPETGVGANLLVDVLPAGSLKSLKYELSPEITEGNVKYSDVLESISLFLILSFVIWLLFVFYLRIKARAIDTRLAMIIAVLAGFIVPGFVLLQFVNEFGLVYGFLDAGQMINGLMILAVNGTISAIGFFVITAVSDSITRQYWPEKLKTWDLVRRGLFRNKPVGWGIINAIGIGGLLAGITGFFLNLFEMSYLPASITFISDTYFLPSLANLMVTVSMVMAIVVPIYLIVANQIKSKIKSDWVIPIVSALLFGLIDFMPFSLEPESINIMMRVTLGLALGYFYLRYDFLTVLFGFFIYVNLLSTSKGWVIEGSPDANTFYLFVFVILIILVIGVYFILKGSNRNELPEYIPTYIEDQAKEQRIKQELSIARVVQQNFLPTKIHHLPGIDISGVCIPAQETGGDYYDMFPLGEHRTGIAIGDVSGKGIQAAFYMTFTKGVLHSLSTLILSPVEILNQLNRLFNENATRGTFISMIYGVLEADKRQFTFARAGHNPMLVVRNNGDTEWLKPDGIGIGVSKGDDFIKFTKEATLKLNEGDVIILYTDGITEMLNNGHHFYGEERLERLVKGVRKASSEKILEIITDDVNEFKGTAKQHDDMTLVIIKADSTVNK
ncbi:MAG: PP2C family protein-serine/threonine phosphatase [Gracilimonas sp.]